MPLKLDKLSALNRSIVEDVQHELRMQGHYLTGNTEKSFENREERVNGVLILSADASAIAGILETGVPSSRIPFDSSQRTGAKTSKYIQGLKGYAMLRFGVGEAEALSIAFAIAKKHEKEGMPTEGSIKYSQTGSRINAAETAFENNEQRYFGTMDDVISDEFDDQWTKAANQNITLVI